MWLVKSEIFLLFKAAKRILEDAVRHRVEDGNSKAGLRKSEDKGT